MKPWEYEIKRHDERFAQLDAGLNRRFNQVNEFRGALTDLSGTMATRRDLDAFKEQYATAHEALKKELTAMARRQDLWDGRTAGISTTGRVVVTVMSTILVLIGIYTAVQATSNSHVHPVVITTTETVTTVGGP